MNGKKIFGEIKNIRKAIVEDRVGIEHKMNIRTVEV